MNEVLLSELFVPFFPCSTIRQVEFTELLIFAVLPDVKSFSRDVTPMERIAGITAPHAIVLKTPTGIVRKYGTNLTLN
jgi:hypothetical protein